MMPLAQRPLLRFTLIVAALLPACFLAWAYLGAETVGPSVLAAKAVLQAWLPDVVAAVEVQNTDFIVRSTMGELNGAILPAQDAGNQLAFTVDTRVLSFSIPFFCALFFATPREQGWGEFAWCLIVLWCLIAMGLVATTLKNLMLGLGPAFLEQNAVPPADLIALAYQFFTLLMPPLAPVVLWAYSSRDTAAFSSLLPPKLRPAQASDEDS